jgi:predicted CXXCH cytochrome family protein
MVDSQSQVFCGTKLETGLEGRMTRYPDWLFRSFVFFCFLLFLFLISPGAEHPSEVEPTPTCVGCHEGFDSLLAETPHRILVSPEGERVGNSPVGCGDCHADWEGHLEEPGLGTIVNPEKISTFENLKLCNVCHFNPRMQECREFNVHFKNEISCSNCHSIYHPEAQHMLRKPSNDLCLECHQEKEAKFSSISHHPVREGVIRCVDCHRALREPGKAFSFISPNEDTIEKEGCIVCHDPHVSPNPRLLKQPAGQLCLQCHFVPRHQTAHGGIWAKRNCLECHVDVHGSYTSKHLFGGACFGRGCHGQ